MYQYNDLLVTYIHSKEHTSYHLVWLGALEQSLVRSFHTAHCLPLWLHVLLKYFSVGVTISFALVFSSRFLVVIT